MGKYSIKELEQLSGIKAHTIRIWEKRHGLIAPQRTHTNIRYYSDEDLKKIIAVSLLNTNGVKISKIVKLTASEINEQIAGLTESDRTIRVHIDQLVLSMIDLDEVKFEKLLTSLTRKYGFEETIIRIVYPFLEKIGVLWLTNNISPAQEHFISNLVRQKMLVAIDGLPIVPATAMRVVFFLPENELHELGLLFCHYLTRKRGLKTYYLGQAVPHKDLVQVVAIHKPEVLVTQITSYPEPGSVASYLAALSRDFSACTIIVSGASLKKSAISPPANIRIFDNALKFRELINEL